MKILTSYKRKLFGSLVLVVLLLPLGYSMLSKLNDRLSKKLQESKVYSVTTATVTDKKYVRFDEINRFYMNDLGQRIEMNPGDEQWRVYYQFDNFDQIAEPRRAHLLDSDKERSAKMGLRFRSKSKEWYEKTKVGDKLEITYHPIGEDKIEVVSVINPSHPNLP